MAQTKHEIQSLLADANTHPRHRFGQNFMIDQNLVRIVADAGMIQRGDVVVEVGPGTGTLTEELLARGAEVVAIEIDRDLAKLLRGRFAQAENFTLIEGDALSSKHKLNAELSEGLSIARRGERAIRLVANLPYNIAAPLVIELLMAGVDLLAFTVQKEVADRLRATAGSEAYGALSVMAQLLSKVEVVRTLPPQAFWPAPKIESALVRLTRNERVDFDAADMTRFVQRLFSFRRKTLRRALHHAGHQQTQAVERLGFEFQRRPEEFSPQQLLELLRATRN